MSPFDTCWPLHYRRIGSNEIDAIELCRGFVEAHDDCAMPPRNGYEVPQFAQRIISRQGKQDGPAWQDQDGSWPGPLGENFAHALEQGYITNAPYHGYFFRFSNDEVRRRLSVNWTTY